MWKFDFPFIRAGVEAVCSSFPLVIPPSSEDAEGSCEGAKLNGRVLDKVLHDTGFTLFSVWREVQGHLFVCKGLQGNAEVIISLLSFTHQQAYNLQFEMQASEVQRKTGAPFPATGNIWLAKGKRIYYLVLPF